MKILRFIYELPVIPIFLMYGIYACVMILISTPMTEAAMLEEDDIHKSVKEIMDGFYHRNRIPFHVISILVWLFVAFKIYVKVTSAS
jgi:hypothetical protein